MNAEEMFDKLGGVIRGAGVIGKVTVNSSLNPLIWPIGLLCLVLVCSFFTGVNDWRIIFVVVFISVLILAVIVAFAYFAKTNPDALRSESYNLEVKKYHYESMGQKGKEIPIEAVIVGGGEQNVTKKLPTGGKINGK